MPIDRGPFNALVNDDGTNTVGSVWNKAAIATVLLDPIDASLAPLQAVWTAIPFDAGNFGSPTGAWTVTTATYAYAIVGGTVLLTVAVTASTITGTPAQLTLWNPIGAGAFDTIGPAKLSPGGATWEIGLAHALTGSQAIAITRPTLQPFPAGPALVYLTIPIAKGA